MTIPNFSDLSNEEKISQLRDYQAKIEDYIQKLHSKEIQPTDLPLFEARTIAIGLVDLLKSFEETLDSKVSRTPLILSVFSMCDDLLKRTSST